MSEDAPSVDLKDPNVLAYRMWALERKFDTMMKLMEEMNKKQTCPSPGLCMQHLETLKNLAAVADDHQDRLTALELIRARGEGIMMSAKAIYTLIALIVSTYGVLIWQALSK